MAFWNRRRNSSAARFRDLAVADRVKFARQVRRRLGYAGFNVVKGRDQELRRRARTEFEGEDAALSYWQRTKFLNLVRNGVRNSETLNTVLKQFEVNVVGTVGGKAAFTFENREQGDELRHAFAKWCRSNEYFDGMSFQEVLKKTLITFLSGGDLVLLFDKFSGKIVAFEPDCISNLAEDDFKSIFPEGYTQRQGRVYNEGDQVCGAICSHSQRGRDVFRLTDANGKRAVFVLMRDPNGDPVDEDWVMVRNSYRFNQGRGTPPLGASLGSIIDLEDVTKFEVQAAKLNAQVIGQIYQTVSGTEGSALADGIDPTAAPTDWSAADDAAVDEAVRSAREEGEDFSFDEIRGAGVIFNKMPASAKLELLDTKHPNANMPEFIRWLAGRAAASLGVGSVYATMKADASYTAFRGEQVMSWPTFEELQKFLEQTVCDWALNCWGRRYEMVGGRRLPDGWQRRVSWTWPRMREVNQVDEQNALQLKLKNFTGSFREVYGPNWRERLDDIAEEMEYFKARGLPHPGLVTVAGAVIQDPAGTKGSQE